MKQMSIAAMFVLGIYGSSLVSASEFCDEIKSLVTDGHKGFAGVQTGSVKVSTASECEVLPVESYSIGELRCKWKYSKFTEAAKLEESTKTLVKSMHDCLKPTFSSSQMSDEYRFRGKSRSTQQLVDVLASSDTTQKDITLHLIILKPDM